jgi:hypothetical protein
MNAGAGFHRHPAANMNRTAQSRRISIVSKGRLRSRPKIGRAPAAALWLLCANLCAASDSNWPQFRGPRAGGWSDDPAPATWNVETGENIRWRTPIPGLGHASPIIWGDRIYVATAVRTGAKAELKVGITSSVAFAWQHPRFPPAPSISGRPSYSWPSVRAGKFA